MARSRRTSEEIARREKAKELTKGLNIHDMDDIQSLFKDMVATILEGAWKQNWMRSLVTASTIIATKKPITVATVTVKKL